MRWPVCTGEAKFAEDCTPLFCDRVLPAAWQETEARRREQLARIQQRQRDSEAAQHEALERRTQLETQKMKRLAGAAG